MDPTHDASAEPLQLALSQTAEGDGLSPVAEHFRGEIRASSRRTGPWHDGLRARPPDRLVLLWDDACERILLHHHRARSVAPVRGHCDGDGDVRRVAQRETREESGIEPR